MIAQDSTLKDYLFILYRSKLTIIIFTSVCVFVAALAAILQEDIYQVSSKIMVDTESANVLNVQDVVSLGVTDYWSFKEYLNTQLQILNGRAIIEEVFFKLNLRGKLEEEYKHGDEGLNSFFRKKILILLKPLAKMFPPKKELNDSALKVITFEELDAFKERLKVVHLRDTRLITVYFELENPNLAAEIVNHMVDLFVIKNLDRKINASQQAGTWLHEEILSLKEKLKNQENTVQAFREKHNLISADERRYIINASLSDLNKKSTEAKSLLAEYKKRYREKHPKMQQAIELVKTLEELITKTRKDAIDYEEKLIEYNELIREANLTKNLLEAVLTREKEMVIASSIHTNNIYVVEKASVPQEPVRPRRKINLILSFILGVIGGCSLVFLREIFKKNVISSEDFTKYEMPFIGYVPYIQRKFMEHKHYADSFILFNHKGIITEIFNQLRTSILLAQGEKKEQCKTVLFSSFLPGEGKTFITTNLSVALAKFNFKTLLIEADLRRPRIKKIFNVNNELGVVELIQGKASIDDCIIKSPLNNLDLLINGSSASPSNPSELLGSNEFKDILNSLKSRYDIIFLDSPPAFAVTDPVLLASLADFVIIVAKYNSTPKKLVPLIKEKFTSTGVKTAGVILNQVLNAERNVPDYTSYYGREYY